MGARGRKSATELAAPAVRLVEPELPIELPVPPDHLSPTMQNWWRQTVADYDLEPHHLKLLEAAFARLVRELDLDEPVPSPARYMPPPSLRSNRRR